MKAPYLLEENAEGLRVTIPASEDYVVLWLLGVVWALWFLLGACLVDELSRANYSGAISFAVPALLFAPIGSRAFLTWAWSVYGVETLALGAETLSLIRSAFGASRTRTFRIGDVRKLRAVGVPEALDAFFPPGATKKASARGAAVFESGGAEIRFAAGLERAQAETLVKHLISRCPGFGLP